MLSNATVARSDKDCSLNNGGNSLPVVDGLKKRSDNKSHATSQTCILQQSSRTSEDGSPGPIVVGFADNVRICV